MEKKNQNWLELREEIMEQEEPQEEDRIREPEGACAKGY